MINRYHRHLKEDSLIQKPLSRMTSVNVPWKWNEAEESFLKVTTGLENAQSLSMQKPDPPYRLNTGVSDTGLGAVLVKYDESNKKELYIMFLSRPLNKAGLNYTTTEKSI